MAARPYPEAAHHREEHKKLTKTVIEFKAKFDQGTIALTVPVMTFLEDWLVNHILCSDKAMGQHLSAAAAKP
jgi:hemerythrin-like metal-binding protein